MESDLCKGIEHITCNLCSSPDSTLLFQAEVQPYHVNIFAANSWNYLKCSNCGLVYENPRPDKIALAEYYSFNSKEDQQYVEDWFVENSDLHKKTWNRYLRIVKKYVKNGFLLDIGCGAGTFLEEAIQNGFECVGQEVSKYYKHIHSQKKLSVHYKEIYDLPYKENSFKVISIFDVIEHHPDPNLLIKYIYKSLEPSGFLVLTTHDIGNIFAKFYKAKWRHIYPIGHLTFFTKETITRIIKDNGFQLVYFSGVHTADTNWLLELKNYIVQFVKLIFLRAIIIFIYSPLSTKFKFLQKWEFSFKGNKINHKKLIMRASNQIIMNDSFICIAKKLA